MAIKKDKLSFIDLQKSDIKVVEDNSKEIDSEEEKEEQNKTNNDNYEDEFDGFKDDDEKEEEELEEYEKFVEQEVAIED